MLNKVLIVCIAFLFSIALILSFSLTGEQQFSYLANSFLHGKLYLLEKPYTWADTAFFAGKYYWPLSPFPAVVLIPFIFLFNLFGGFFLQGYIQFFIVLTLFYLIYKISLKVGYSHTDSLFLAFGFCFSTAFLGVALLPWSWYFSQVISVFLSFLALYEFLTKKRYIVLGIITGCIFLTRSPASLIIILFILDILFTLSEKLTTKFIYLVKLITPLITAFLLGLVYNYARFRNVFEFGYGLQAIPDYAAKARDYGVFNLIHVPGNLYYFLLSPPLPVFRDQLSAVLKFPYVTANSWGMSIFFTSPVFIYLFVLNYKKIFLKLLGITVFFIAVPIFFYYGIGFRQFGYRYSLDFLPVLFLMLIIAYKQKYKQLSAGFKIILLMSACANLYLFMTLFFYNYAS